MSKATYKTYQPSPLPWNKEIPAHWIYRRGKFLFKVINQRSEAGAEELLSVTENWGVIPRKNANVNMFQAESYEGYKLCKKGDLVINSLWAWGKGLGFSEYEGIVSTAYSVYRLKKHSEHNYRYFNYLLRTPGYVGEYLVRSKGVWISRLQLSDLAFLDMQIIIPPLEEQTAIVSYLDAQNEKINLFISKKQKLIELLKEQKQAVINKTVIKGIDDKVKFENSGVENLGVIPKHWKVRKLKFVADVIFSNVDKNTEPNEIPVELCNYVDVYKNDYINNSFEFMKATATESEIKKFKLEIGDVIVTKDSETPEDIAVPALVVETKEKLVCGYHLAQLKPSDNIMPEYLFRLLQSDEVNFHFTVSANGVTRYGVGVGAFKNVFLPLPPLEEQKEIVQHIKTETKRIDEAISRIEKEIELIKEYRQSLIAEVVTGKIKVIA